MFGVLILRRSLRRPRERSPEFAARIRLAPGIPAR